MNKINVAVFFGGESLENEVSKITGAQIIHALNKNKYKIFPIYIDDLFNWWHLPNYPLNNNVNTTKKIKINISSGENNFYFNNLCKSKIRIDCAILAVHGGKGENGHLSGILNSLNIPHTASCSLSSGLTMNKHLTKIILNENKMNCLPYEVINKKEFRRFSKKEFEHYLIEENSEKKNLQTIKNEVNAKTISYNKNTPKKSNSSYNNYKCLAKLKAFIDSVHFPIVVKPVDLGSSIAVSFVNNVKQLYSAIELVFAYSNSAILEKGIKDVIEYNCSAMKIENSIKVSEIEKPIHKNAILTYADKYGSNLGCKLSYTNSQKLSQNKMHITNIENRKTRKEISTPVNSSAKGMCSLSREFPAKIPVYLRNKIEALTKNAYEIFNCSGIVRCDFIYYKKKVYLNEINSIPGSLAYYLWSTNGYNFSTLLDELIRNSIKNNT